MARDKDLFQLFDEICKRRGASKHPADGYPPSGKPPVAPITPAKGLEVAVFVDDPADLSRDAWRAQLVVGDDEALQLEYECANALFGPVAAKDDTDGQRSKMQPLGSVHSEDLRTEVDSLATDSAKWSDAMWSGLSRLRKRVDALAQNGQTCARPGQLTLLSRGVERDLECFKTQQRQHFETMAAEELALDNALMACHRRFDGWLAEPTYGARRFHEGGAPASSPMGATDIDVGSRSLSSRRAGSARPSTAEATLAPSTLAISGISGSFASADAEINEIKKELAEIDSAEQNAGGPTGGWPASHHDTFLRIFRMYKNQPSAAFFARMEERFGTEVPRTKVEAHVEWLYTHEQRQSQRRMLFGRWRDRRSERDRQVAEQEKGAQAREAELRRLMEQRDRKVQEEQKVKVAMWKRERAEMEQRAALMQWTMEQEQAKKAEQAQKKQRAAQKQAVDAYRRSKEAERSRLSEGARARSSCARRSLSYEERQRIERRTMDLLRRKLHAQEQAHAEAEAAARLAGARSQEYEHVESRLHDTTESFIQKIVPKAPQTPNGVGHGLAPADRLPPRPPQGQLRRPSSARVIRGV